MLTKLLPAIALLLPLVAVSATAYAGSTISDKNYWPSEARQGAAPDNRYCIQGDDFAGGAGDCSFASYQQCQATASGRKAHCGANPWFPNVRAVGNQNRTYRW
ncbi:MAG: DUF3551 domain-containing protein [Pseudomonadota bacterium]